MSKRVKPALESLGNFSPHPRHLLATSIKKARLLPFQSRFRSLKQSDLAIKRILTTLSFNKGYKTCLAFVP